MTTITKNTTVRRRLTANIRRLMIAQGLTYRLLAARTKDPLMTVHYAARGAGMPSVGVIARIAAALGTTVDELLADPKKVENHS